MYIRVTGIFRFSATLLTLDQEIYHISKAQTNTFSSGLPNFYFLLFLLHSILPSHFSSFSTPGGNTCLMFASQLQTLKCCLHTKLFFKMWTVKVVGGNQDWFMTGTSTQLRRGFFFFCNRCTFGLNPTQSRMSSRNETAVTKVAPFRGAGDACDQHLGGLK